MSKNKAVVVLASSKPIPIDGRSLEQRLDDKIDDLRSQLNELEQVRANGTVHQLFCKECLGTGIFDSICPDCA